MNGSYDVIFVENVKTIKLKHITIYRIGHCTFGTFILLRQFKTLKIFLIFSEILISPKLLTWHNLLTYI